MVNQRDFPGWGHMLEKGATTLWEHWEYSDNTFSHNHPMFGSVSEWFYKSLGGIQPAPDSVGFDRAVIRPNCVGDLTWVRASYDSARGKIVSKWRKEKNHLRLNLRIPVGVSAQVYLPATNKTAVLESGRPAERSMGVTWLRMEAGCAVYKVEAGEYAFETPLPAGK
jgi:alpha-L-rhamnosidase